MQMIRQTQFFSLSSAFLQIFCAELCRYYRIVSLITTMFHLIFITKAKLVWRLIFRSGLEHWMKVLVGIVVVGLFFFGAFEIFRRIFDYLVLVQDIGPVLVDRLISIGFLAFFAMLLVSNLVSSISTLFRSVETGYLMATPLSYSQVFWSRFVDNFFYSSWATAIIGLPMAFAYFVIHKMPFWQMGIVAILLFCFLLVPAYIGSILSMFLLLFAKKFTMRRAVIVLAVIAVAIGYFYIRQNLAGGIMFNVMGDLSMLNYYLRQLGSYRFPYFPHIWFAEALRAIRIGMTESALIFSSALLSTTYLGAAITDSLAGKFYHRSFEAAAIISGKKKKKFRSLIDSQFWKLFSPFPVDVRAMLTKDVKLFLRDPNQWSQFAVLLVLLVVYLANLRFVPMRVESLFWKTAISFANFTFSGYVLATLSVRFVYPSISMEGKSLWSIVSSPVKLNKLFWEKFILAFVVFFVIAELVAVISNGFLSQNFETVVLTAFGILLMSLSLVSLNVGLGIIFPNFEELNPMRIASSGGGMIAALLSLFYVALMVIIIAAPVYRFSSHLAFGESFQNIEFIISIAALVVINLAATLLPLRIGSSAIGKREF